MKETQLTSWAEHPLGCRGKGCWEQPGPSSFWLCLLARLLLLLHVACSCGQVTTTSQGSLIFEIPSFSSCLSHPSPCRDKTPGEGSLREEGLIVAHGPRVQPVVEGK